MRARLRVVAPGAQLGLLQLDAEAAHDEAEPDVAEARELLAHRLALRGELPGGQVRVEGRFSNPNPTQ